MKLLVILSAFLLIVAPNFGQLYRPKQTVIKEYHLITLQPVDWFKAFYHCRSLNMNLVSVLSKAENDQIIKHIKDEGHENKTFWTSGTKLGNSGVYQWMASGKSVKFTDWAPGQPDNLQFSDGHESCIEIFGATKNHPDKWNDRLCSAQNHFICEQEQIEFEYCSGN